jgi:hypothetical protein
MVKKPNTVEVNTDVENGNSAQSTASAIQRKIPGNLPYLTASGTLKKALDGIIPASRPDKFNADFLEHVLKLSGGGARATIPILKKMGFLTSEGVPTEIYAKFRTEGGKSAAATQGLRSAFPEIFKRSEWAHTVDDAKLRDIVVEITGLSPSDPVVKAIIATFKAIRSFVGPGSERDDVISGNGAEEFDGVNAGVSMVSNSSGDIRLAYNINIVLPETSDLKVLNAIFRSIRENLMR